MPHRSTVGGRQRGNSLIAIAPTLYGRYTTPRECGSSRSGAMVARAVRGSLGRGDGAGSCCHGAVGQGRSLELDRNRRPGRHVLRSSSAPAIERRGGLESRVREHRGEDPLRGDAFYRSEGPALRRHGRVDVSFLLHQAESGRSDFEEHTLELQRSLCAGRRQLESHSRSRVVYPWRDHVNSAPPLVFGPRVRTLTAVRAPRAPLRSAVAPPGVGAPRARSSGPTGPWCAPS